jgi:DeoR/GlpR family transcriptional regulator of sugar metabolism
MRISAEKRIRMIAERLIRDGYVKDSELAAEFHVSMETVRKDLLLLEERGVARKEYGGASLAMTGIEKSLSYRNDYEEYKQETARHACRMISACHSLILDAGSTCEACISYLNQMPAMDIFTNSLPAVERLDGQRHHVFALPGRKRERDGSLIGDWTSRFIDTIHADVCFLGTAGLWNMGGPSSHSYEALAAKRAMVRRSDIVYVLADSHKFKETGVHTVVPWNDIDGIITDHHISNDVYALFAAQTSIYTADEN